MRVDYGLTMRSRALEQGRVPQTGRGRSQRHLPHADTRFAFIETDITIKRGWKSHVSKWIDLRQAHLSVGSQKKAKRLRIVS
jgi:hypothetical protein